MAGETARLVPAGTSHAATHRPPRPLHSRAAGNETGKDDFAPGHQAETQALPPRLSPLLPTHQEATTQASPTSGPRRALAPHIRDCGCMSSQSGYNFEVQLCSKRMARIIREPHPTAGNTDGLRGKGSLRLYFEEWRTAPVDVVHPLLRPMQFVPKPFRTASTYRYRTRVVPIAL
jgi:hypothetical protein